MFKFLSLAVVLLIIEGQKLTKFYDELRSLLVRTSSKNLFLKYLGD